jgi:hypothetical protein
MELQHPDLGQIANLPCSRQVGNLPHGAELLERPIPCTLSVVPPPLTNYDAIRAVEPKVGIKNSRRAKL